MINAIFTAVGDAITAFAGVIGNGFTSIVALFYTTDGLTPLGYLSIIGFGISLGFMAWGVIRGLMSRRG